MIIGIDLGTTYSVAAYLDGNTPKLIPNALGEYLTPSVVGIDRKGNVLVGKSAKELQVVDPGQCAALFKRYMGTDHELHVGKKSLTPEQLSSFVLKSLKSDAEAYLKTTVDEAVITVPAYFNDRQRKATIAAGQIAGLQVRRILNEPTAAALAYGLHEKDRNRTLIVLDLGGGTFDVSIIEIFEGTIEVKASSGECFLGGEDFTTSLASDILRKRGLVFEQEEMRHPKKVSRLVHQCEIAKRRLSLEETASIRIPDEQGEFSSSEETVSVARSEFAQLTKQILQRMELPIRRCLGDAKVTRSDLDEVLLVGGATRMPSVIEYATTLFQRTPQSHLNPDEVVAMGAAIQAGLVANNESVEDLVVTDVCPFTLGIGISKEIGDQIVPGYFLPIINRNTTIPVSRVEQVQTISANQTSLLFEVFQGESRMNKDNLKIGSFTLNGIPLGPAGQPIAVRFTYDLNGVLEVEITIVKSGKQMTNIITHYAKNMSPKDIQRAVKDMAGLKVSLRDDVVNQTLLLRAERVFKELPPRLRDHLGQLIDGFESALELRELPAIAEFQSRLTELLDDWEGSGGNQSWDDENP